MTLAEVQKQHDECLAFMQTELYAQRQRELQVEIDGNALSIVTVVPDSQANISVLLQLHGQRNQLLSNLSEFETILANLKQKLSEMTELSNTRA